MCKNNFEDNYFGPKVNSSTVSLNGNAFNVSNLSYSLKLCDIFDNQFV